MKCWIWTSMLDLNMLGLNLMNAGLEPEQCWT
jgi:hypothetical protein